MNKSKILNPDLKKYFGVKAIILKITSTVNMKVKTLFRYDWISRTLGFCSGYESIESEIVFNSITSIMKPSKY